MLNKLEEVKQANLKSIEDLQQWFVGFLGWVSELVTTNNRNSSILALLSMEFGEEITVSQETADA